MEYSESFNFLVSLLNSSSQLLPLHPSYCNLSIFEARKAVFSLFYFYDLHRHLVLIYHVNLSVERSDTLYRDIKTA
jgi:hypothetical protein